jgi:hypothetical protein
MKMKYTVIFNLGSTAASVVHVTGKTPFEAVRMALTKVEDPKKVLGVAGVFIGWHISKYSGEV